MLGASKRTLNVHGVARAESPAARGSGLAPSAPVSAVELWEDLSSELWQVQHGFGEPRLMTLGELDAAYRKDEINAYTLVRKAGTSSWRTLGAIAGVEPSAVTLESESLIPVASEIDLAREIPKPPPVPGVKAASRRSEEWRSAGRPRALGKSALSLAALVVMGGVVFVGVSAFLAKAYDPTVVEEGSSATAVVLPPVAMTSPEPAAVPRVIKEESSMLVLSRAGATDDEVLPPPSRGPLVLSAPLAAKPTHGGVPATTSPAVKVSATKPVVPVKATVQAWSWKKPAPSKPSVAPRPAPNAEIKKQVTVQTNAKKAPAGPAKR